jgi:hypothetical protein
MSSGLLALSGFAGTLPGLILLSLGQIMVVVCLCVDMVRELSVPRSHARFIASTVFQTLVLPSILVTAVGVLMDAAFWSWLDVILGTFVIVTLVFRWHYTKDEDNWWKGKGKKLARWLQDQTSARLIPSPVAG